MDDSALSGLRIQLRFALQLRLWELQKRERQERIRVVRQALERRLFRGKLKPRDRALIEEAIAPPRRSLESFGFVPRPHSAPELGITVDDLKALRAHLQRVEDGDGEEPERAHALRAALLESGMLWPKLAHYERVGLLWLRFVLAGEPTREALEHAARLLGYDHGTAQKARWRFFMNRLRMPVPDPDARKRRARQ